MKKVKLAMIGCGGRGYSVLRDVLLKLPGVEVVVACDLYEDRVEEAVKLIREHGGDAKGYLDYKEALTHKGIDAAVVFSSWDNHADAAIYAMEHGIPVGSEVGCEYSVERCFDLVRTQERTGTPYMFIENCCYGKEEMLVTSMVRAGVFGTVVHCAGMYAHDLRGEIAYGIQNRHYRFRNYLHGNCENYPTHELGPIARLLDVNRGNRILTVNSISSKSVSLEEYIREQAKKEDLPDYMTKAHFNQGDIVSTIIKCANGETIHIQLDTTLPRFYSRGFTVRGTKALYLQDTNSFYVEGEHNEWGGIRPLIDNAKDYEDKYLPDVWRNATEEEMNAGHGGMDYYAFGAFVDAVRENKKMPIDVYDGATWMAVSALSAQSIATGGATQFMPDFTGGKWMMRQSEDV